MEILNSFLGQGMVAQIGEIVLFANTVTMAMSTRVKIQCGCDREDREWVLGFTLRLHYAFGAKMGYGINRNPLI